MKKIAYVLADFPALSETFIGNEIRAMRRQGHEIVPIAMHLLDGPAQPEDKVLAAETASPGSIPSLPVLATLLRPSRRWREALAWTMKQRALSKRSLLWNALKIATIARRHGCTHVHAHFAGGATAHAIVAARWIGATVSFIGHGHDIYSEPEDLVAKLSAADFVVGTCDDMVDDFRSLVPTVQTARIACGTDLERFRPANGNEPADTFLAVGRLVGQKGYEVLLEALARCRSHARIDVIGTGPLEAELKAMASSLGLGDRITWLGPRPNTWIAENGPRYLALLAPFRMDSKGERDTSPVVIKEAAAMGLPVIATRFMGAKEMVVDGVTGLWVEPSDVDGLANAIDAVANMEPARRRAMGLAGRQHIAEHFTLEIQSRDLSALVEAA
ncbi:MAG: glycosyltransferase family 4 protein [Proteobacteria bacterium]|nr:glycosyltransferase family 4 protein [Pseudomonadota bacterium]